MTPFYEGDTGWMDRAACHDTPQEVFFPAIGKGRSRAANAYISRAKAICAFCPVRPDCLDYALDHGIRYGIWGGASEDERRAMRRTRRAA